METSETEIIVSTQNWIREVVVGLNFCPFAAKPFKADLIEYRVDDSDELAASLETFIASCHYLENNPELETGLVIYSQGYKDFEDYLSLVELAEKLLIAEGFEGIYQVASFHPNYLFAGSDEEDPANYTNRSPFPMLHILREDLLEIAIEKHVDVDAIPDQNIEKANQLGLEYFKKLKF
jgi:hypothetical protein